MTSDYRCRYSILPAMSYEGYIALDAVEGSVTHDVFYSFLVDSLVSCTLSLTSNDHPN